jgi:hypothetical protein
MRLGFSILLAVLAMLVAGPMGWAEPLRVSTLEAQASAAVEALETALAAERRKRDEQALLANRIAALKRDRSSTDGALLERLLRESIDADRALSAQIKETRRAEQAVSQVIARMDALLASSRSALKASNPLRTRKQAAQEIIELRAAKSRLAKVLAALKGGQHHRDWADHVVAIDPLDGPSELADKTDVLALTQKKIEQKKQQLAQLIHEKKISQAARDFAVDATALDDDLRTGRVQRRVDGSGGPAAAVELADDNRAPPAVPSQNVDDVTGAEIAPGSQNEADNSPPPADPSRDGAFAGATQPQVGVPGRKTVQVPSPAALPSITVAKQIDPNDMINLRVDQIDADSIDVATLEKYIAELESMQKALATQAQKIKSRSQQLQRDEAGAKSK